MLRAETRRVIALFLLNSSTHFCGKPGRKKLKSCVVPVRMDLIEIWEELWKIKKF
jgi:hypothetical protein